MEEHDGQFREVTTCRIITTYREVNLCRELAGRRVVEDNRGRPCLIDDHGGSRRAWSGHRASPRGGKYRCGVDWRACADNKRGEGDGACEPAARRGHPSLRRRMALKVSGRSGGVRRPIGI